jgi:hypothetical protein
VDDGGLKGVEVKEGRSDGRRLKLFSKHFPKRAVRAMLVAGERGAAGGARPAGGRRCNHGGPRDDRYRSHLPEVRVSPSERGSQGQFTVRTTV